MTREAAVPGAFVFAVMRDQRIWRGRLVGLRGVCASVVDDRGVCRVVHLRYVWADGWAAMLRARTA